MKAIKAIKLFFEQGPHGRKVGMDEMRDLTADERQELGRLACVELGETFEAS